MANMHVLIRNRAFQIIAALLLLVLVFGTGVTILARPTSDHDFHRANIVINGKIDGQLFELFSATRLQNNFTSAVMLHYKPYTISIYLIPEGHRKVKARFNFVNDSGLEIKGLAVLSTLTKHAVNLSLNGAPAHTQLTARLITNE
ncbi:hypothetical protein [Acidithiobacillus ferrivorans]|uniref:Uncharacterized protein n=1 Tax=Acidithiobacillus ferrivorans TaxID=160808 RepID=A0A7T4WCE0_9PROT|nr:hypothetical protein [Acidithiobacillus ferrivorans]QQD71989.1 hypothetical protein H2515_11200 [Acidithiobacillus ferrivorans]